MQFNADKTEEVIFSCKRNRPIQPGLKLGDEVIGSKLEHKLFGVLLDPKLNFKSHIREAMPTIPDEEDGEEILVSEVEKTIKDLKIGKAPGMDEITTEMIKALDEYSSPSRILQQNL